MHLLVVVSFALLAMVCGFKPMRDSQIGPRRRFILWESGLTSNQPSSPLQNQKEKNKVLLSSTILASLALIPEATKAARGAFEMDAEVYLRSLIGQRPNAVFQRPIFPSPRTINKDFAESVLKILLETISEISGKSPIAIQRVVEANLPYSIKYFQTFLPIKDKSSVQDQYYFDIYLYNCYLEVAKLIPKPDDRVGLQKQFGRKLLHMIYTDYLHDPNSEKISKISSRIDLSLRRLLNVFFETGMIGGFRLADEKLRDEEELNAFASDEDYTLNFDVTIEQPVCLISFLEQSAASSLFHPNIVAYVLQAYLESPGIKASFDDYLFDNYYKENNFNPQAQDILITYTLSRS